MAEEEGLRALEQEVIKAAEEHADEITGAARARAAQALQQAREEGETRREQAVGEAQQQVARERARVESATHLEARRRHLAAREAVIDRVLEAARSRLAGGLSEPERRDALVKTVLEAATDLGGGRLTVRANAEDLRFLTLALREEIEERLARQGVDAELEPGPPAPVLGGAIVSKDGGRVVLDNSFDARLERQSWALRNEIWQALTEKVPVPELA